MMPLEVYILFKVDDKWFVYCDSVTGDPAFTEYAGTAVRRIKQQHPNVQEFRTVQMIGVQSPLWNPGVKI